MGDARRIVNHGVAPGDIPEELGVSRNALAVWLIRHGIAEMEGGHLTPKTEKVEQIKLAM